MFTMNSVLTLEERTLLQSLGCRDKAQAIEVLEGVKMILPIRSEIFRNVLMLIEKLKNESIDYTYEMTAIGRLDDENIE
jgi:hypothetical protein